MTPADRPAAATTTARFLRALVAVLAGNTIYFAALSPVLPEALRHRPFTVDLGLLLDLAICAAAYWVVGRLSSAPRGGASRVS